MLCAIIAHFWILLPSYTLICLSPFPKQNVLRNIGWVLLLTENHIQKRFMATIIPGRKKCVLHVSIVVVLNDPNHVICILHHRRLSRPNLKNSHHLLTWLYEFVKAEKAVKLCFSVWIIPLVLGGFLLVQDPPCPLHQRQHSWRLGGISRVVEVCLGPGGNQKLPASWFWPPVQRRTGMVT